MKEIGKVLHLLCGNRAIAKVKVTPKPGSTIYDIRRKPIGRVVDIFGPVKSPYIEIEVKEQDQKELINSPIYVSPKDKGVRGKR